MLFSQASAHTYPRHVLSNLSKGHIYLSEMHSKFEMNSLDTPEAQGVKVRFLFMMIRIICNFILPSLSQSSLLSELGQLGNNEIMPGYGQR